MNTHANLTLSLAGFSWARRAMSGSVSRVGLRALVIADPHRITHQTDWAVETYTPGIRGTYATLDQLVQHMGGPIRCQVYDAANNVIVFEYDGITVRFL